MQGPIEGNGPDDMFSLTLLPGTVGLNKLVETVAPGEEELEVRRAESGLGTGDEWGEGLRERGGDLKRSWTCVRGKWSGCCKRGWEMRERGIGAIG